MVHMLGSSSSGGGQAPPGGDGYHAVATGTGVAPAPGGDGYHAVATGTGVAPAPGGDGYHAVATGTGVAPAPGGDGHYETLTTSMAPAPGGGLSSSGVVVTPDMVVKFAGLLREAADPMDRAEGSLASASGVLPGLFPDGDDLRKFVGSGREGRVRAIMENNNLIRDQLRKTATKLEEVARRYTNADDLNQHLVEEMTPILGSFQNNVFGNTAPAAQPAVPTAAGLDNSSTQVAAPAPETAGSQN
jgi:hypothetical protein